MTKLQRLRIVSTAVQDCSALNHLVDVEIGTDADLEAVSDDEMY